MTSTSRISLIFAFALAVSGLALGQRHNVELPPGVPSVNKDVAARYPNLNENAAEVETANATTKLPVKGAEIQAYPIYGLVDLTLSSAQLSPVGNATAFTCPAAGCHIHVHVTMQVSALTTWDANASIAAVGYLDGSTANLYAANPLGISTYTGNPSTNTTVEWDSGTLCQGNHLFQMSMYVASAQDSAATAGSFSQTGELTVQRAN